MKPYAQADQADYLDESRIETETRDADRREQRT